MTVPATIPAPQAAETDTGPKRLTPSEFSALQAAFNARLRKKLDKNLPADLPAQEQDALERLLRDSVAARAELDDASLRDIAHAGPEMARRIKSRRKGIEDGLDPFSLAQKFRIAAGAKFRSADKNVDSVFGGDQRIYLPLGAHYCATSDLVTTVRGDVSWHLAGLGYRITDYVNGYATDKEGKQKFRIGKILNGNPGLQKRFIADASRVSHKMLAVVSRDITDIARMSANRGWHSCMSPGHDMHRYVARDIARGTLVAYLVTEGDTGVNDPLARILLKPYRHNGVTVYRPEKTYGLGNDAFRNAVEAFTRQLNRNAPPGVYKMDKWLYTDGARGNFAHRAGELDAEGFLRSLGVKFSKTGEGISVNGNLDLSSMGLRRLPDLSGVRVSGAFLCQDNMLESLAGLPRHIGGDLNVENNLLQSLEGCPEHVGGVFCCSRNLLTSLKGGPKSLRGNYICSANRLESLEGAPEKVPFTFYCEDNPALTSLKGGPRATGLSYRCAGTGLVSLEGAPEKFEGLSGSNFAFPNPAALADFVARTGGSLQGQPVLKDELRRLERRRRIGF